MSTDTKVAMGLAAALIVVVAVGWAALNGWGILKKEMEMTIETLRDRAELAESRMVPSAEVMDLVREATGAAVGTQRILEAIERRCE